MDSTNYKTKNVNLNTILHRNEHSRLYNLTNNSGLEMEESKLASSFYNKNMWRKEAYNKYNRVKKKDGILIQEVGFEDSLMNSTHNTISTKYEQNSQSMTMTRGEKYRSLDVERNST